MATKKEIFEQTMSILNGDSDVAPETIAAITALLEPKSGGKHVDLSEVTTVDGEGNVLTIQCSVSDVWLDATAEFFYEDKSGKGITGLDGISLKRVSKDGYSIATKFKKTNEASIKAIMEDVLEGNLDPAKGKKAVDEIKATKPDFSTVGQLGPEEPDEDEDVEA